MRLEYELVDAKRVCSPIRQSKPDVQLGCP